MKNRKILPLLLLAFGSVFLLSSCDALLDAIFSNNNINVYISSYIPTHGFYPRYDTMTVYVSGPHYTVTSANYNGDDGLYMYWSISVPKLSDGTYNVDVSYSHPYGINTGTFLAATAVVTFPMTSGSRHDVDVDFVYP
jgi:hypothetical protein